MEEKKTRRGRPATGRKRDKSFRIFITEEEKTIIKNQSSKKNMSMVDYIIDLVKNDNQK